MANGYSPNTRIGKKILETIIQSKKSTPADLIEFIDFNEKRQPIAQPYVVLGGYLNSLMERKWIKKIDAKKKEYQIDWTGITVEFLDYLAEKRILFFKGPIANYKPFSRTETPKDFLKRQRFFRWMGKKSLEKDKALDYLSKQTPAILTDRKKSFKYAKKIVKELLTMPSFFTQYCDEGIFDSMIQYTILKSTPLVEGFDVIWEANKSGTVVLKKSFI